MKHHDDRAENFIQALIAVINKNRARGVPEIVLVAGLADLALRTATADEDMAQIQLDALAAITKAAADAHRGKTVMNMAQAVFGRA